MLDAELKEDQRKAFKECELLRGKDMFMNVIEH